MTIILPNLAIAGYRSFGKAPQYFERFAKINLLIGRNNAGKSNVIRFINEIYQKAARHERIESDLLAQHQPGSPTLLVGIGERIGNSKKEQDKFLENYSPLKKIGQTNARHVIGEILLKLFEGKRRIDGTELCWTLLAPPEKRDNQDAWKKAFSVLDDNEAHSLWAMLSGRSGGGREAHWEPESISLLSKELVEIHVQVVPAIRQIGSQGSTSEGFDGKGIIERLAKLQNPDVHNQAQRERFSNITKFLRVVLGNSDAHIEIPYARDTISVHMDGKVLPIESLGSGVQEVVILAAAATGLSNHVICIEEPEMHLNPVLQKKLLRYLSEFTDNQYFISTHSAALMDNSVDMEIYHVKLHDNASVIDRVTSDSQRSLVCEDLGYHPSDLLQANCIIWVEGPSDRIYLNWWIRALSKALVEGIHFSIMFYGGRLAAHLSNEEDSTGDDQTEVEDFISLRRLNRRGVFILDSDREDAFSEINSTKRRLQGEFDQGPGHAWVTQGREIENYIEPEQLRGAMAKVCPRATIQTALGQYDNCLRIKSQKGREGQAPKVEIAKYVVSLYEPNFAILDLEERVRKTVEFILASNPQV